MHFDGHHQVNQGTKESGSRGGIFFFPFCRGRQGKSVPLFHCTLGGRGLGEPLQYGWMAEGDAVTQAKDTTSLGKRTEMWDCPDQSGTVGTIE